MYVKLILNLIYFCKACLLSRWELIAQYVNEFTTFMFIYKSLLYHMLLTLSLHHSLVYILLQVFWVILLFCQIVLLSDINAVQMSQWYNLTSQ